MAMRPTVFPKTNEEILISAKYERMRMDHHRAMTLAICAPKIPADLVIPPMTANQAMNICNKSVAIYSGYDVGGLLDGVLIFDIAYLMGIGLGGNHVEFGRSVAGNIGIHKVRPTRSDLTAVHAKLCDTVDGIDIQKDVLRTDSIVDLFVRQQAKYFQIRPSYRALIIALDSPMSSEEHGLKVRLIRTGKENHLTGPISFASIQDPLEGDKENPHCLEVVVHLITALRFVMDVDQRESRASQKWERARALDEWLPDVERFARRRGFVGPTAGLPAMVIESPLDSQHGLQLASRFAPEAAKRVRGLEI